MRRGKGGGGIDPTGAGDQTIVVSGESYVLLLRSHGWADIAVEQERRYRPNSFSGTLPLWKILHDQLHRHDAARKLERTLIQITLVRRKGRSWLVTLSWRLSVMPKRRGMTTVLVSENTSR
jgi:hypothetical protein